MKKFSYLFFVVFVLVFSSCNKDITTEQKPSDLSILHFDSYSQMEEELETVLKMNTEEKVNWAAKKDFTSYGVEADLFYDNMDVEGFQSKEELLSFINNSKYLELVTQDNSDLYIETKNSDSRFRYFMNEDQVFTVGDKAVKVFGGKTISTCIENIEALKQVQCAEDVLDNPDFELNEVKKETLKSALGNCGTLIDNLAAGSGDYLVTINAYVEGDGYNFWSGEAYVETGYKIQSWKKNWLGIYVLNEKTITYNMHFYSTYYSTLGFWSYQTINHSGSQSAKTIEYAERQYTANYRYDSYAYFKEYNVNAYSSQTTGNPVHDECD
ncbi:MAG: hypothetical protein ACERKD_17915 [Prolixibacteraceae bacterium]